VNSDTADDFDEFEDNTDVADALSARYQIQSNIYYLDMIYLPDFKEQYPYEPINTFLHKFVPGLVRL
jgi:hypothetical protein